MRLGLTLMLLLLSACAATPTHEQALAPLHAETRAGIGILSVSAGSAEAGTQHGTVRPISPGEAAGAWVLGATAPAYMPPDPFAVALGLVIGIVGAPIAAATGSISEEEVKRAEHALTLALTDAGLLGSLRGAVLAPLRASRRIELAEDAGAGLSLLLHGPFLEIANDRQSQPLLRVRGMLRKDGACLADRYWAWNGKPDDFFDLAEGGAKALRVQLSHGIGQVGEAIAQDLFLSNAARKVLYREGAKVGRDRPIMIEEPTAYPDALASWPTTADPAITEPCAVAKPPTPRSGTP